MRFEWDPQKNIKNIQERGIDFADAWEMFEGLMLIASDVRQDYGEDRYIGMGHIRGRLMVVAYTERAQGTIRIISLRKANTREQAYFEKTLQDRLERR